MELFGKILASEGKQKQYCIVYLNSFKFIVFKNFIKGNFYTLCTVLILVVFLKHQTFEFKILIQK